MADDSKVTALHYNGVTFDNLRKALYYVIYGEKYDERTAYKFIIPSQGYFLNPIEPNGPDTYVHYFITRDEKITQDQFAQNTNFVYKAATVSLRFIGAQAESWAKFFHHLTKFRDIYSIFMGTCQAELLEAIGDIIPTVVTFDGINTLVAFDLDIRLVYKESIDLPWEPLVNVILVPGEIDA